MKELLEDVKGYGTVIVCAVAAFFGIIRLGLFFKIWFGDILRGVVSEDIKAAVEPLGAKLDDAIKCFDKRFRDLEKEELEKELHTLETKLSERTR